MLIGVPKEVKDNEFRVGLVPPSVEILVAHGHQVMVESEAGSGIGVTDDDYRAAGAEIIKTAKEIFRRADMIVKVKEPQPAECKLLRENQLLFAFLHLAPDPAQTDLLQASRCVAIAYETVTDDKNGLPLLAASSAVAGRMSIQAGAHCLEKSQGGRGILLCGMTGAPPAKVVILGGGVVGSNALRMAVGMESEVTLIDKSQTRLEELAQLFGPRVNWVLSTPENIRNYVLDADLVIGAVLVPGASAPKLVSRDMIRNMRQGSVVVDVSIDQGGCFESSRPTTHTHPTYVYEGVVHYCVTNMPGAVARTATFALNHATLPFVVQLADKGFKKALKENPHLMRGLNIYQGQITYEAVAKALNKPYVSPEEIIGE